MGPFQWTPQIAVGNDHIDGQHRRLLELANEVAEIMATNDYDGILKALDGLLDYTRVHFRDEEEILRQFGYADIDQHIAKHHQIIASVDFAWRQRHAMTGEELFLIVRDVILRHITVVDGEYRQIFG